MEWKSSFLILVIALFTSGSMLGQVGENRYIVYFSDKANTPYTLDNPFEYLSDRAIERRQNQGIAIDVLDLPVDPAYITQVQELGEVAILNELKWFNAILIETIDPNVLQGIQELHDVDRIELSTTVSGSQAPTFNRIRQSRAKSDEEYGPSLNQIQMLNGLQLHDDGFKGDGMWIGVLDGGFANMPTATAFETMFDENRLIAKRNFVDQNETVFVRSTHGAYVMSVMAGMQTDSIIGTAPEASYLLCITEDVQHERRIEEALWTAAAAYADSIGVDILNTSLGYTNFDVIDENYTYADLDGNTALITRASDIAASRGMLVVSSAGNNGDDDWYYIGVPADGDSVLAIGAVGPDEVVTDFSSRGPSFDGRVKPNVMAQGGQTVVSNLADGLTTTNGTSLSSPVLTGMAACLWQAYPHATAWEVHQAIEQSAHLYNMPNDSMGYGIPDFEIARTFLSDPLGVNSAGNKVTELLVFPNPVVESEFSIYIPNGGQEELVLILTDVFGRTVVEQELNDSNGNRKRIALNKNIAAGTYLVSIRNRGGAVVGQSKLSIL